MQNSSGTRWTPVGEMIHKVQFQSRSTTRDGFGQQLDTWTTYYSPWAKVGELRGQMLYQTAEFISQSTYKINLLYPFSAAIGVNDRAICNGQTFVIDAVLNLEMRNRELQILCHVLNEAD
jgi:SPP1 family predicted phage head-tail adaptor